MSYVVNSHAASVWAAHRARQRAVRGRGPAKGPKRPAGTPRAAGAQVRPMRAPRGQAPGPAPDARPEAA